MFRVGKIGIVIFVGAISALAAYKCGFHMVGG